MLKRLARARLLTLGGIASLGMLFQTGGCAFDPQTLFSGFVDTFANILIANFVGSLLGGGLGF